MLEAVQNVRARRREDTLRIREVLKPHDQPGDIRQIKDEVLTLGTHRYWIPKGVAEKGKTKIRPRPIEASVKPEPFRLLKID